MLTKGKQPMIYLLSGRWKILLLILLPLLISLACKLFTGSPEPNSQVELVLGPGPFTYGDMKAGLADLSSYRATLTYSFDGTRAGQSEQWSKIYVMQTAKEPATRQLTIETTGNISAIDSVFMAEAGGAAYEQSGKNACTASMINEEKSLGDWLEPAGFLTSVVGADKAGAETVNNVATDHYTFDERALGELSLAKSTGEMWIASEGGYIVKYVLTTKADASYFGEGIEGMLTWEYELTDANQPVSFDLPSDCPAGMVNAPPLPDAVNIVSRPGLLSYDTASSLTEVSTFYQNQIPALGWTLIGEPATTDTTAFLSFTKEDQEMSVIMNTADSGTNVHIVLGKIQE
jgi:hypothetical protein